jgi:hypothetical protein
MSATKPFPVILHVRVPDVLRGSDHHRYLERKLSDLGVTLRPPPNIVGTDIPAGYGLVSCGDGWHVVEARGELARPLGRFELMQLEIVEDVIDAEAEDARRAARAAQAPPLPDDAFDENVTAGGPMPNPFLVGAVVAVTTLLKPAAWLYRGFDRARRWYVRERS